jgi:alanine-glyoxylate transaminase/serine-glyoxylate transaminase/serine-pyruvate transaminase
MSLPVLSHLDPAMMVMMDELRDCLGRVFCAPDGALSLAVSGTGSAGMEAPVANTASESTRVAAVVNGYFGDRLARMFESYGASVTRIPGEWGRACDPEGIARVMGSARVDILAVVHAETSTGVLNPLRDVMAVASAGGALTVVDAVTSLGGMPVRTAEWGIDVCYSCTQKGLGAPSGLAPISFSARARGRQASRSFYFDLALLEDYWVRRKYHHTISAPLIYALREALAAVEDEGLEARWSRHEANHLALAAGLGALGLELLPPPGERLWTLNAVRVPEGVDESAVRRRLLEEFGIEIGAGLGPLAGRIWRVGLMGSGSTLSNVLLFLSAFERVLRQAGVRVEHADAALTAAEAAARN